MGANKATIIFGIVVLIFLVMFIIFFFMTNWTPAKHSVKLSEFSLYENFILVKEVFHTGTGWTQVGDESGYFESDKIKEINLDGEKLPFSKMGRCANTFLCIVEYGGKVEHVAHEEPIDSYKIIEWYPVYPVIRDGFWPSWMLPSDFMTKNDMKSY